ncbi:synthetase [Aureococcus anophagefferens]|nr:synthetase [Aureococcus anophagefferens]
MAAAPDDVDERVLEGLDLAVVALPAADAPPAQMSRRCALGLIALSSFGFAVQSLVVKALGCCGALACHGPVARPPARWFGDTRTEVKWLCARGFVGFGGICFSFKAVSMIGLESQVVGTVSPVFAAAYARLFLGEPWLALEKLAAVVSFAGVALQFGPESLGAAAATAPASGWPTFGRRRPRARARAPARTRIKVDWPILMLYQAMGQILLSASRSSAWRQRRRPSPLQLAYLGACGFLGFFSQVCMTRGMQREKSASASIMRLSGLPWSFLFQALATADAEPRTVAGGLIVLVAMGIVVYAARRKAPAAAAKPVAEYAPVEDKDGVELAGTFAIAGDDDDGDATTPRRRRCMVIKPWGMAVWDRLRDELDGRIKASGAENAYFPLLIPRSFLAKEAEHCVEIKSSTRLQSHWLISTQAEHVEGFAKECAVVTHHRLAADGKGGLEPDPAAELDEPLIIRPTSETMIWHMFGKWINSHRDLPLKINQWANVVRWEMRTRPFLRSSEFLWQEGHTAARRRRWPRRGDARRLREVVEHFLAVPVVRGAKSAIERFAGADETYTIEALMPNGWALQSGTSHFLGQNFARAFDVQFQNKDAKRELVWATSWGVSTRLLGALVMTHSDDAGLVLPPRVAPVQVAVVPITRKNDDAGTEAVDALVDGLVAECKALGVRVKVDERPNMRPGAKFFEWERRRAAQRRGRPARRRASSSSRAASAARSGPSPPPTRPRTSRRPRGHPGPALAAAARDGGGTVDVGSYDELKAKIDADDLGFFRVYWAADDANEKAIKGTSATIRCYPLDGATSRKACLPRKPATHVASSRARSRRPKASSTHAFF